MMGLKRSKERLSASLGLLSLAYCLNKWLELIDSFSSGCCSFLLSTMLVSLGSKRLGVLHLASIKLLKLFEVRRLEKLLVLLNT